MPMRRPYFIHIYAIEKENKLSLKGSLALYELSKFPYLIEKGKPYNPESPLKSFSRFTSTKFLIKIEGFSSKDEPLFSVTEATDEEGRLNLNIVKKTYKGELSYLNIYEISYYKKVEIFLGRFIPLKIKGENFNLIISDFDKTLVDTKYSNTKEIYKSLTSALEKYPVVESGLTKLKDSIKKGYIPFILSASPHFYEEAIRDFLYKNKIFNAEIFLKDFRKIFSFFGFELETKDITAHGVYKFNSILSILELTGMPSHLILMGDSFESDPLIYSLLVFTLSKDYQEELLFYLFEHDSAFKASKEQINLTLSKIKSIKEGNSLFFEKNELPSIDIYIRNIEKKSHKSKETTFPHFLEKYFNRIIPL